MYGETWSDIKALAHGANDGRSLLGQRDEVGRSTSAPAAARCGG
jgi:hypothetical protein